jgi:hypothetical protein
MTKKLHIGIVGSRRRDMPEDFILVLKAFFDVVGIRSTFGADPALDNVVIVSGGCKKGGDRFAKLIYNSWSNRNPGLEYLEHLPKLEGVTDEKIYKYMYAKAAYARNNLIAQDSDVLIACVAADRKGGTEHTIKEFRRIHHGNRKVVLV